MLQRKSANRFYVQLILLYIDTYSNKLVYCVAVVKVLWIAMIHKQQSAKSN